ncbi:MAG: hypothetical protein NZ908_03165 [Candidatus Micrarchaeota archaeon]|nr:hypothetical protein [Candidatus Micrarchaeota archaeon]MCX8154270.1 hypothetical protein [Candidatus Micrarchaeota archaeon]
MKRDLRERFLRDVERELQEPSEEQYLINLIRAYYDLKDTMNLIEERLVEWVKNSLYIDIKDPKDARVIETIRKYGMDPTPYQRLLNIYISLIQEEKHMREYIEKKVEEKFPNASYLVGPFILGMMLERIGSYRELVEAPSSTIQVIGAERALFKHIRSRGKIKPPKHGIIYLSPWIHRLPKRLRGKMARALASKLSIALKADMGKRDIRKELYEQIRKRFEELEKEKK